MFDTSSSMQTDGSRLFSGDARLSVVELQDAPAPFVDLDAVRRELAPSAPARLIDCRVATAGPWAGALSLLKALWSSLEAERPDLVERHRQELAAISPTLRLRFPSKEQLPLTESGPVKERVRSYPVDRAFRLAHGLVDLLLTWQRREGAEALELICWGADDMGAMTGRFLNELVRRGDPATTGGIGAPIRLVLVVSPGRAEMATRFFDAVTAPISLGQLQLASSTMQPSDDHLRIEADLLESRLDANPQDVEAEAPRLVALLDHLDESRRAARWRVLMLAMLNHFGWYEDALFFAEPLIGQLDQLERLASSDRHFSRWHIVSGLFNALAALGRAEEALVLVRDEALAKVDDPSDLVSIYYTMAMLNVRFLPKKDLELGESYLNRSLEMVERAPLEDAEKHYLKVFNLNGLALIRHLQGEPPKAVELCEDGYNHLEKHLASSEYRLHRSVLLYNLAQVFAGTGQLERAHEHYTGALAIDPNYSEYYNERAGVLLRMGRLAEAEADLLQAIELSPPYPEVWINLGQVQNQLGNARQAVMSYERALDLDPTRVLPWLGLAQAQEALGEVEQAARAYRRALGLDPDQPLVWANLAALDYEGGRLEAAHQAIEEAVRQQPENPTLYQNRAVVLEDLGKTTDAAADLLHYLQLVPDAEDATEVRAQVRRLTPASAAV
ncbi:MAG: tetratricopeptide repeat protein [Acidobacteriota bacterium]